MKWLYSYLLINGLDDPKVNKNMTTVESRVLTTETLPLLSEHRITVPKTFSRDHSRTVLEGNEGNYFDVLNI